MEHYLIIVQKKGDYYSGEHEELWLPTTEDEIERVIHHLGCRLVVPDYQIKYTEFGYAEIDKMAYDSDVLALNRLAMLLQDLDATPNELCAELVFTERKNIYDVIAHLENRPNLVVVEDLTDIVEAGEQADADDFWNSTMADRMTYEEYKDRIYYGGDGPIYRYYIRQAMWRLRSYKFRFTPYGLVYEDPRNKLPF